MASYEDCCKLTTGINLEVPGCVVSISTSSSTDTYELCGEIKTGPTIGTINLSAYAEDAIFIGCQSKAGVSINWTRKFDCDANTVYFIKSGSGQSYIMGDVGSRARLIQSINRSYPAINASAGNGPSAVYMETTREDGFGLVYTGLPWSVDTSDSLIFQNFGVGTGPLYLQNFSLDLNPGAIPISNYTFLFYISEDGVNFQEG